MKRPKYVESRPLICRFGLHRFQPLSTGGERCIRAKCDEVRFGDNDAPTLPVLSHEDFWIKCTRWDGVVVYNGPIPVPRPLDKRTPEDKAAGRRFSYECTLIEFEETAGAQ